MKLCGGRDKPDPRHRGSFPLEDSSEDTLEDASGSALTRDDGAPALGDDLADHDPGATDDLAPPEEHAVEQMVMTEGLEPAPVPQEAEPAASTSPPADPAKLCVQMAAIWNETVKGTPLRMQRLDAIKPELADAMLSLLNSPDWGLAGSLAAWRGYCQAAARNPLLRGEQSGRATRTGRPAWPMP